MEKDIKQQFINFLKKQKCYDDYMLYFNTNDSQLYYRDYDFEYFLETVHVKHWLDLAFSWNESLEGHAYWYRLHSLWDNKIRKSTGYII